MAFKIPTFEERWNDFKKSLPVQLITEKGLVCGPQMDALFRAMFVSDQKYLKLMEVMCRREKEGE